MVFQRLQNKLTNPGKIVHYITIGKTNNCDSKILHMSGTLGIILLHERVTMLGAIQFHCEFGFVAEKIQNIVGNDLLPTKSGTAVSEKIVP